MAARRFAALLSGMLLTLLMLLLPLYVVGTDDGLYYALQQKAEILDEAGIDAETLRTVDDLLADCLRGNPDAFLDETGAVREITVFGSPAPVFNARERTHMEDCRRLFLLLKTAIALCGVIGGALLWMNRHAGRKLRNYYFAAPALLLLPLVLFGAWACADFDAAFRFFHRLLFTNDLWLLDPATDLLIRICPETMFSAMAARIAGGFVPGMALYYFVIQRVFGRKQS